MGLLVMIGGRKMKKYFVFCIGAALIALIAGVRIAQEYSPIKEHVVYSNRTLVIIPDLKAEIGLSQKNDLTKDLSIKPKFSMIKLVSDPPKS
jgi:hypothetical protein